MYQPPNPPPNQQPNPPSNKPSSNYPNFSSVKQFNDELNHHLAKPGSAFIRGEVYECYSKDKYTYITLVDDHHSKKEGKDSEKVKLFMLTSMMYSIGQINLGEKILVEGKPEVYPFSGDLKVKVLHVEKDGEGAKLKAYEQLKVKLKKEGYFDRKRPIPRFPKGIGLITPLEGAVLQDFLDVWRKKCPQIPLYVSPATVQGFSAMSSIKEAYQRLFMIKDRIDVLAICRGGGSKGDLDVFDTEEMVKFVFASYWPTVSGVGHQTDHTLIDSVADLRATTPTQCAELIVPSKEALFDSITEKYTQIALQVSRILSTKQHQLSDIRLEIPYQKQINQKRHQLEALNQTLTRSEPQQRLNQIRDQLNKLKISIEAVDLISHRQRQLEQIKNQLDFTIEKKLQNSKSDLESQVQALDDRSPLNILKKGFTIVSANKQVLKSAENLSVGDEIEIRFEKEFVKATITETPVAIHNQTKN
jgi:exodeoxyribonuclease VII large subunit